MLTLDAVKTHCRKIKHGRIEWGLASELRKKIEKVARCRNGGTFYLFYIQKQSKNNSVPLEIQIRHLLCER